MGDVLDGARWEVRQGDCLELLRGLPDSCVDLVVMDPPYNQGIRYGDFRDALPDGDYRSQQWDVLSEVSRVLRDGGTCFYLHWPEFAAQVWCMCSDAGNLVPVDWVTWVYRVNTGGEPFRKASRAWVVLSKGTAVMDFRGEYVNRSDPRIEARIARGERPREVDWWYFDLCKNVSHDKVDHPCQLPVDMVAKIVSGASMPNDLVLDPFCGSGTTGVAAAQLGRRFLGMELSPDYCAMARQRIGRAQPPLLAIGLERHELQQRRVAGGEHHRDAVHAQAQLAGIGEAECLAGGGVGEEGLQAGMGRSGTAGRRSDGRDLSQGGPQLLLRATTRLETAQNPVHVLAAQASPRGEHINPQAGAVDYQAQFGREPHGAIVARNITLA